MKENKLKGWANLQQQLKEVREESFKQGIWKGEELGIKKAIGIIEDDNNSREDCIKKLNNQQPKGEK